MARRRAAKDGAPIPVSSIDEYRRIKDVLPDDAVLHLALKELPSMIFNDMQDFNYGFHNKTGLEFTADETKVLGFGHKFVMTGYGPTKRQLQQALFSMNRRVLLRDFYAQKEAIEGKSDSFQPDRIVVYR